MARFEQGKGLVDMCQKLRKLGLAASISDSVSCRVTGGGFLVTRRGMASGDTSLEDAMFVDSNTKVGVDSAEMCMEWRLHEEIYRKCSGAEVAVHLHSTHAAALSSQRRGIPAFHYMVAVLGGKTIDCSEYAAPGTADLCTKVLAALGNRKAALIANHGFICYGPSFEKAVSLANEVECLAKQYVVALSMRRQPTLLSDEEMDVMLAKFKTYGKQPSEISTLSDFERQHAIISPERLEGDPGAEHNELRQRVITTCLKINSMGINQGTSGNASCRVPGGFLVTASGIPYEKMKPEHVVFMNMDGKYYGPYMPSSEWRMHYDVYKSVLDAQAVVHAHPTYSTALSCIPQGIPAFHYMVAVAGGKEITCAKYATFGTQELSDNMLSGLASRRSVLLSNHGATCYGTSLETALWLLNETEHLARQYTAALATGTEPTLLAEEEIETALAQLEETDPLGILVSQDQNAKRRKTLA